MTIDLSKLGGEDGREDTQWFTHELSAYLLSANPVVTNRLWLDVGAGLCHSKPRIERNGFKCFTQDSAPNLPVDITDEVWHVNGEFGVVSAFDVIEHIEPHELNKFCMTLKRLAKHYVVVSAPYNQPSKYHFNVFSPSELLLKTSVIGELLCAYDLHDGFVGRADYNLGKQGAFGGLLIYKV